mgnify:CR=1 FL=1
MPAEQDYGAPEQRDARTIEKIRLGRSLPAPGQEGRSQDDIFCDAQSQMHFLKSED